MSTCTVEECVRPHSARGLCEMHYSRWYKTGSTADPVCSLPPEQRLMGHVRISKTGCWLWQAHILPTGYGQFCVSGIRTTRAHRVAWILLRGPIGDDLDLDHLCRVRSCVNPDHLEPVTRAENSRRGHRDTYRAHVAGTCFRGHAQSEHAVFRKSTGRVVYCKACRRDNRAAARTA